MHQVVRAADAHLSEPDYTRPLLQVTGEQRERILGHLTTLYGPVRAASSYVEVERLMRVYYAHKTPALIEADRDADPTQRFTERDVVLITYGDIVYQTGKAPLHALRDFLLTYMHGAINTVHILPFFPSSSDRGFAIVDYEEVDPSLGSWDDIAELGRHFKLMFDGVFNHVSSKSQLFQRFLNGHPGYEDVVVAFNTRDAIHPDYLRLILRPRTSSLLTPFRTINGTRYVWTTFSPDQVDLNFKNERVLQRVVEILLYYVRRGADIVRLDAVTYIWRELGTSCAHLERDARARQAVPRDPRRRRPAGRDRHRDQRAARRQHRLLRRRRRRSADGLQLRVATARPPRLPSRRRHGADALGGRARPPVEHGDLLQLPRLARRRRSARARAACSRRPRSTFSWPSAASTGGSFRTATAGTARRARTS